MAGAARGSRAWRRGTRPGRQRSEFGEPHATRAESCHARCRVSHRAHTCSPTCLARVAGGTLSPMRFERPFFAAGLALITIHLLDLALSGPDTSVIAVIAIVAVPLAALWAQ